MLATFTKLQVIGSTAPKQSIISVIMIVPPSTFIVLALANYWSSVSVSPSPKFCGWCCLSLFRTCKVFNNGNSDGSRCFVVSTVRDYPSLIFQVKQNLRLTYTFSEILANNCWLGDYVLFLVLVTTLAKLEVAMCHRP